MPGPENNTVSVVWQVGTKVPITPTPTLSSTPTLTATCAPPVPAVNLLEPPVLIYPNSTVAAEQGTACSDATDVAATQTIAAGGEVPAEPCSLTVPLGLVLTTVLVATICLRRMNRL